MVCVCVCPRLDGEMSARAGLDRDRQYRGAGRVGKGGLQHDRTCW